MQSKYVTLNNPEKCLGHVVEECGEVLSAAGKIMRHGWYSVNPEIPECDRETNIVWLKRELADLKQAITNLELCDDFK